MAGVKEDQVSETAHAEKSRPSEVVMLACVRRVDCGCYTIEEISRVTGHSVGHVGSVAHHAVTKLAAQFREAKIE